MKLNSLLTVALATFSLSLSALAATTPLKLGVGPFQPDKDKNEATYTPLAEYLSAKLGRPVELKTVDSWEGLAKSLANGETDLALMGPWGYVIANNEAQAQVVATVLYDKSPFYHGLLITHPGSGIEKPEQLKGKNFAFGDKGSTSGYLIPFYFFQKKFKIKEPEDFFGKVIYTKHPAIETQVTRGELDGGADYDRNRNTMIEQGLIKAKDSKIIWESDPLPNDAFAVSADLFKDKTFVKTVQTALTSIDEELKTNSKVMPAHYTGFVKKDNSFYKPIRDAGLATGKLVPKADAH